MTYQLIGPAGHQFVIGTEAGVNPPLTSECTCTCPGKKTGEQQEEDRERDPPHWHRSLPKPVLPQQRIRDDYEQDSPAGTPIYLFRPFGVSFVNNKWRQPDEPSCCQGGVRVDRHPLILPSCTKESGPA